MTAHDPRVTLTEAEVERIADCQNGLRVTSGLFAVIADVIADRVDARLAPIRALADLLTEQGDEHVDGCEGQADCAACVHHDLMAALGAPVSASQDHDGAEGQGQGEKAAGAVMRVLRDLAERTDNAVRHLDDLHATRTSDMERARLTGKSQGAELIGGYIDEAIRLEERR